MRKVLFKPRIERDMKKMARRGKDLNELLALVGVLVAGEQLPKSARVHKLSGQYEGLWECHIESDWLLIFDLKTEAVILHRTGTHTDLFE